MARQTYSRDFKVSAAKLVTEQGRGLKNAATSLGVPTSTMQYWVRRFGTPAARPQIPDDPAWRTTDSASRTSGSSWSAKS
jgi:transposase-like protein